jgi:hypothetical protein
MREALGSIPAQKKKKKRQKKKSSPLSEMTFKLNKS